MDADVVTSFHDGVVKHPEVFFTPSEEVAQEIKAFTKHVFDHCTKFVSRTAATPLDQLYVDGFDADQIWEQLRLQNTPLVEELSKRIRTFQKKPEAIQLFPSEKEEEEEEEGEGEGEKDSDDDKKSSDDDEEEEEEVEDANESNDSDEENASNKKKKAAVNVVEKDTAQKKKQKKKKRDVAEDGFFDWDEMDKIAEEEEEDEDDDEDVLDDGADDLDDGDDDEERMDDDSDDDDDDDLNDEDAANMTYDDFFEEPEELEKGSHDDDDEEEEEDEDEKGEVDEYLEMSRAGQSDEPAVDEDDDDMAERGIMSSHERQNLRLQKEIKQYEAEAIGEKPWLLKGEVRSGARPENSLLEAVLDYDRPVKVAPVITVEVSVALEDMIKKRILEDEYDDVIRRFAPNENDQKNKLMDVSMEKSKEGLGEIYEKEYMKTAMGFEADDESKKDQEEIEVMFKSLCWKLDALSNYQFTPKPMVKELQVKPSVAAIAMEEVVPISVSDANLRAPEEVYEKKRKRGEAVLQSKEEMSQNERKALRNAKKRVRRKEKHQAEADERLVAKINPGLGNKYAKKKMLESIANAKNITTGKEIEGSTKQFSNSKEFFSRLQDEVQGEIRKKTSAGTAN